MTTSFSVPTSARCQLVDITSQIQDAISNSGISDGLVVVYVSHTTAGITINENADPDVKHDILSHLEGLIPQSQKFRHSEGNSDAHIKSSLMGSSVSLLLTNGSLVLGVWQAVFFCEFDGPRTRKVWVKVLEA